jgi:glycosyltransferase involved in cell wall biosynthesis
MKDIKLTIITATYNACNFLPKLIDSLASQSDKDFEWVIADGNSTDKTLILLENAKKSIKNIIIDSRQDSGISDAINRAIKIATGDYFVIIGADDFFYSDAVFNFKKHLFSNNPDILCAKILADGKELKVRKPDWLWLYGSSSKIACTAIGTAYKKSLVDKAGYFDTKMQIYADGLFALRAIKSGASIISVDFIAGEYAIGGLSNSNPLISFSEDLRAKLLCGYNLYIQLMLFVVRVLKSKNKILKK